MKKGKMLGNSLFLATLISPMVSFYLMCIIGEANIFGVAGIVRYSWIMWLFIPICVLSIFIGLVLKKSNQKYKKNFIIVFICLPLLIIFGSYRFIFNNVSYNVDQVSIVEEKINIKLPDEIKAATIKFDLYNISYVKITNDESKAKFEQELEASPLWQRELVYGVKGVLPIDIQCEVDSFDAFVFYNTENHEYNTAPSKRGCDCIFIAYDYEMQKLIVLDGRLA